MNTKLTKKLRKLAPVVYAHILFDVNDGWYQLLAELGAKLEVLDNVKIAQIKEKFGTLRVYLEDTNVDAEIEIGKAERASSITCERCGKPGGLVTRMGFSKTICNKCY